MSIRIPTKQITSQNIDFLEKRLYVQQEINDNKKQNLYRSKEKYGFFKMKDDYLYVPFYFGQEYFGKKHVKKVTPISIDFHGILREKQNHNNSE